LQLDRISNSIELMERNLDAIRANLENLVIKAPIGGQLTSFNPQLGETKARGEGLGTIDVMSGYKVTAMIDEYYISRIQQGQEGSFPLNGEDHGVRVSRVIPEVNNGQFEAQLVFTDSVPAAVTRGQTLQIKLALSNTYEAKLVPRGGFYQSTGGNWMFVLTDEGHAVRRDVKLGRQNTEYIEVLEGLEVGERILTNSYTAYEDAFELKLKN
jgi:HlyD family secretion protein